MSADNGIYVLRTKDGYRVAHLQAIENLYWNKGREEKIPQVNAMIDMFGACKCCSCIKEVDEEVTKIMKRVKWTEYGVIHLNYPSIQFPKEKIPEPNEDVWFESNIKIETLRAKKRDDDYYERVAYLVEIDKGYSKVMFRVELNEDLFQKIKENF